VTLYISGMFGVSSINCKWLHVTTGVKYAQYDNAIRVEYIEPRKRNGRRLMLDYKPWLRISALASEAAKIGILTMRNRRSSDACYFHSLVCVFSASGWSPEIMSAMR
jgi:hypothetical protein